MARIKREPCSDDDPHAMGTPQRPITIDEGPVGSRAAPTRTDEGVMAIESPRERMGRVERGQGFKNDKRGAGTKVKSEEMEQTGSRPMTAGISGKGAAESCEKEVGREIDHMEIDDDMARGLGVANPTGPLYYGSKAVMAATETANRAKSISEAARRSAKLERRRKTRDDNEELWAGAERTWSMLLDRLPDSEWAVFNLAMQETMKSLKIADQRGKKKERKERSRVHRALEVVRDMPLFREICNTDVDRGFKRAIPTLSNAARLPVAELFENSKGPTIQPYKARPVDNDTSSTLAKCADGLMIDDTIVPKAPVLGHRALTTFERSRSTEPKVPVKSELSTEDSTIAGNLKKFHQKHASIWEHHESAMRSHFQGIGFPQAVYSTKLAIQKKGFQAQAANEIQVEEARRITEQHLDGDTRTCITDFGGTAFDTQEFPSDGLWELSSTKLWHYYQEGDSWEQPGWIPGGYLRIRQLRAPRKKDNTFQAEVILEFGAGTYSALEVTMPLFTNSESLELVVRHWDHYEKQEAVVRLRFFQGGHVQVVFPAAHLIKMDKGCDPRRAHGQLVEFAGVFMGETD